MAENWLSRTETLLGREAMERLGNAHVAVFGLGGVGGHCAEALVRSGIGHISLFDKDIVSVTNINRQLIATTSTVGQPKAEALKNRLAEIAPAAEIIARQMFYLPENADEVDLTQYDYIVDAVDNVSAKLELAVRAKAGAIPIISAMGAGNKLDPTLFRIADIAQTKVCPLARVMRRELKKRGIEHLKVVYSEEEPVRVGERMPASIAFCPPVMGMILASAVVRELAGGRG